MPVVIVLAIPILFHLTICILMLFNCLSMKLYTFHKVARPLTDYLNKRQIPFKFRSVNPSCHVLLVTRYSPSVYGSLTCSLPLLLKFLPSSLSYSFEGDSILIF